MLSNFSKLFMLVLFFKNAYALNSVPSKCFDFNEHPITAKLAKKNYKTPMINNTNNLNSSSSELIKEAKKPANFANYLRVMSMGCGISCQHFVVFNKKTGEFFMVPVDAEVGAKFQVHSSLFIINPLERIEGTLFNRPRSFFWDDTLQKLVFMPECSIAD
jgi:hypothetical protein